MTARSELFDAFAQLHDPESPLILRNIWDAGGAKAVVGHGAAAIATSSWAVAASHGYADGETLPFELVVANTRRIIGCVDVPVTIDLERGYGRTPDEVAASLMEIAGGGAVGCNLEDGDGHGNLRPAVEQAARIAASRSALRDLAPDFFIHARTDLFLINAPDRHAGLIDEAMERAVEYGLAGANGFFVPGLTDHDLLADLARRIALPVNTMTDEAGIGARCKTGVARISLGPTPYMTAMRTITHHAQL